jgi:uncharacterized membrane protein YdjX (TVP38/TMEM64 family)
MNRLTPKTAPKASKSKLMLFTSLLGLLFLFTLCWQFTSLKNFFTPDKLLILAQELKTNPLAPLLVTTVYLIGGFVAFPVFILIPATALVFGPLFGGLYSLLGLLANASILYGLGHILGHETITRLAGNRINQLSQQLANRSILTIATLRFLPLAPFTVINLIAGASQIRFREYTLGTLIGILPAIVIMSLVGTHLGKTFLNPDLKNFLIMIVLFIVLLLAFIWFKKKPFTLFSKE